jgi:hypothetical protein
MLGRALSGAVDAYRATVSLRAVLALAMLPVALTACAGRASDHGVRRAVSTFTCCTKHDVSRVYHPGDVVTIHWIRKTSRAVVPSAPTPVTLTAHLDGSFSGVVEAKEPGAHGSDGATAQPVHVTDRTLKAPVSRLRIPLDAAPGLYNLTTKVADVGGWVSGGTIIRVTAR